MKQASDNTKQASAVIYLRCATKAPAGQADPIDRQRETCRQEAKRLEANVVAEFVDRGASGNDRGRRGLTRLLHFITKHRINYVIVCDLARLARRHDDYLMIRQAIEQAHAVLVVVNQAGEMLPLYITAPAEAA